VGSRAEFERLYAEHAGAVRGYALRRCNAAVADDVVADVFLVAWRRLEAVPEDALPWLLGTARRVLANHARARDRWVALHERLAAERSHEAPAIDAGMEGTVLRALASLGPTDREALLLVAWEGLAPARAARALDLRPASFAVRLHRARRRLAAALAAQERQGRTHCAATPMEVSP
jgi:RNA polymerase sigma-70 factor (ECF subfamily)